jgi:hypothetical protein
MDVSSDKNEVQASSVVQVASNQTATEIDGEKIILDLRRGIYYGLNPVGADIWDLIQTPTAVDAIVDAITAEYEVDREQCMNDTVRLIETLHEKDLVEITS